MAGSLFSKFLWSSFLFKERLLDTGNSALGGIKSFFAQTLLKSAQEKA